MTRRSYGFRTFPAFKDLRHSLESDWTELQSAFDSFAWKSVHVLAGSIVEAILVDHLLYLKYEQKDPLKMSLEEAIAACKNEGILTDKTAELSTVIRRYRNLIHPGRSLRLSERADVHGANVCKSLVLIISEEVAKAKRRSYGYTAEQIASKVERDPSVISILSDLLKKTGEREIERLLLEVLPERYLGSHEADELFSGPTDWIRKVFHAAFEKAEQTTKERVAKRFITVLHEADGSVVRAYEEVFFRPGQLEFLSLDDAKVVKQHAVSQMKEQPTTALFSAFKGIGRLIQDDEVESFVDAAFRHIADPTKKYLHRVCAEFVEDVFMTLPAGPDKKVLERGERWKKLLLERNRSDDAGRISAVIDDLVPF
ncbi:MAG: hypothetical protein KIT09_25880 [Bryobacteraceae bacterium]|nr:hypothetical protein [Bryobacteraceae bacterium]